MKTVNISDITLREIGRSRANALSFKERVEIARTLDRLGVDEIELPALRDGKAGVLSNKTIASVVSSARLSAAVGTTEESVTETWESVKAARQAVLHIMLPASSVQMEYLCHKKAPAILELARELTAKARYYTEHVAFSAIDATRADPAFLCQLIAAAAEAGAEAVTVCDSAGIMTPRRVRPVHSFSAGAGPRSAEGPPGGGAERRDENGRRLRRRRRGRRG